MELNKMKKLALDFSDIVEIVFKDKIELRIPDKFLKAKGWL